MKVFNLILDVILVFYWTGIFGAMALAGYNPQRPIIYFAVFLAVLNFLGAFLKELSDE